MKDLHSALLGELAIGPASLSADNTPAAIDLGDHNSAEIFILVGVGGITFSGTNKIEFVVTDSDDDVTYEAVTDDDVLGVASVGDGGIVKALVAAHAAAACYRVGYKGGKRFLKILADFSGTHGAATPITVLVVKSHGRDNPQANQI